MVLRDAISSYLLGCGIWYCRLQTYASVLCSLQLRGEVRLQVMFHASILYDNVYSQSPMLFIAHYACERILRAWGEAMGYDCFYYLLYLYEFILTSLVLRVVVVSVDWRSRQARVQDSTSLWSGRSGLPTRPIYPFSRWWSLGMFPIW